MIELCNNKPGLCSRIALDFANAFSKRVLKHRQMLSQRECKHRFLGVCKKLCRYGFPTVTSLTQRLSDDFFSKRVQAQDKYPRANDFSKRVQSTGKRFAISTAYSGIKL